MRDLWSIDELRLVVALETEICGQESAGDVVSVPMMAASLTRGAILLGAFDAGERLVRFAYAFPGLEGGRVPHWSHALGITSRAVDFELDRAGRRGAYLLEQAETGTGTVQAADV